MKIGIITFHWATNYGAILQSFALQQTLQSMGHNVEIIDYKPKQYEPSLWQFLRYRQFLHLKSFLSNLKKERGMVQFRRQFLKCTQRYYSISQLRKCCIHYDLLISGSDQVMNPNFLQSGEKGGSTAYFLDFGKEETKRITYAMSFGTTKYPEPLILKVSSLIKRFNAMSVREITGKDIFSSMGWDNAVLVPDPTLLLKAEDYDKIIGLTPIYSEETLVYMLHNRLSAIRELLPHGKIKIITSETIGEWIQAIRSSRYVITNSFHGMVFCLLYHIPFTIVLQSTRNEGMNDRFFTLLDRLGLEDRIMCEADYREIPNAIDWENIDKQLDEIKQEGLEFLTQSLR